MKMSESIAELAAALVAAQAAFPEIPRNREVAVATRSGGTYKFKYATLDAILGAVRKPLTDNGLTVSQVITVWDGVPCLETVLLHKSGQWIISEAQLPTGVSNQEFGSALSYMRRYALSSILSVVGEEDDDANIADQNVIVEAPRTIPHEEAEPQPPGMATTKQLNLALKLARDKGVNTEALHQYAEQTYGVTSLKMLRKADASDLIDHLMALEAPKAASPTQ